MRYWLFVILLLSMMLLVPLTGCEQTIDDISRTAVAPPLADATPILSTPSEESVTSKQENVITTLTAMPTATSVATVEPTSSLTAPTIINQEGALVRVSMTSQVGVLLDEIPAEMRDSVAADLLAQPEDKWLTRTIHQVQLTRNRLNFRNFIYSGRGQLPLPPPEIWDIHLDAAGPTRQTIQGHDLIMLGYTFTSTLLTDERSPGQSEPSLAAVGGIWDEPFVFPADPDLLLQRTGNACVNEGGFPPNSFDSENIWHFYDFDCTADSGVTGCHRTYLPNLSCRDALTARIGAVETSLRFERLMWDAEVADQVRVGAVTSGEVADLTAVAADLATNRIIYRYFNSDDCALAEGAVGGSGWRRLLQFDATVWNVGERPLHVGRANVEDTENNVFTYSPCHDHFHYTNYGDFFLQDMQDFSGSKQAFCVQSTTRMSNNETTPLTHDYSCSFQGVQAGWADEYIAGLDAQWVDITDLEIPLEGSAIQLGFTSNGDQFLCEGIPLVDENGVQFWEPSGFMTSNGASINRPQCGFIPNWDVNNQAMQEVFIPPSGSFVTAPCTNDEIGPLRNCGFVEVDAVETVCEPGTAVELTLPESLSYPLTMRVCERSAALGIGMACTYETSLLNQIVRDRSESVAFICPTMRDSNEVEGRFALYTSAIVEFEQD